MNAICWAARNQKLCDVAFLEDREPKHALGGLELIHGNAVTKPYWAKFLYSALRKVFTSCTSAGYNNNLRSLATALKN